MNPAAALPRCLLGLGVVVVVVATAGSAAPPCTVIDHVPAATRSYVGSPSLAILPDGTYVASHDLFGGGSDEWRAGVTDIFASGDRGTTWRRLARVEGAFWSGLFVQRGDLHLMGTGWHHGPIVIRRSRDGGATWTEPRDARSGLLTAGDGFHTAPVPVLVHGGRIWRGFEDALGGREWGTRYRAMMLSAADDADLLDRDAWTFTNALPRDPAWLDGRFRGWLEGNAVATADGRVVDILRVDVPPGREVAAIVDVSADGRTVSFDPAHGFVEFPGGAKKFSIRRDPATAAPGAAPAWWALADAVPPRAAAADPAPTPAAVRNTLVLLRSGDLRTWEPRCVVLHHPDAARHAFQYVDWLFDGDDLVLVSRTAFDDDTGNAHAAHDANFLTFHRVARFRRLTMADSVVPPADLGW